MKIKLADKSIAVEKNWFLLHLLKLLRVSFILISLPAKVHVY